MAKLCDNVKSADWKTEKHVPVIECHDQVTEGELFQAKVTLGKEIAHPNTTEHHIRWITLYFHAHGEKFNYEVGHYEFNAHGESADGANKGPVYTNHEIITSLKISKSGTLHALAFCNIHGLWESSKEIRIA
ncbi:MAG: class II SORL domain-containing protein [Candidatus Latescibacteria bacterium]|nr:class II SORL domain-containing protein [Candidatus Latescibacterota bacterium]